MLEINFLIVPIAALIPMVIGFIWYNPNVFGKIWMAAADMTDDKMKGAKMGLIFGLSFLFACLLAFSLMPITLHQFGAMSLTGGDPTLMGEGSTFAAFMAEHGTNFMTFKHGALHGAVISVFFALPIFATNAMFERKGFKYVMVNWGYWCLTITLMGGVVCQWGLKIAEVAAGQ